MDTPEAITDTSQMETTVVEGIMGGMVDMAGKLGGNGWGGHHEWGGGHGHD